MDIRRVSVVKEDAGHAALLELRAAGKEPEIYLDGEKQDAAVTADVDGGYVDRRRRSFHPVRQAWVIQCDPKTMTPYVDRAWGKVEIKIVDRIVLS